MQGNLIQNWCQNGVGNAWRKASKRKLRKCDSERQYSVLARFVMSGEPGNRRKITRINRKFGEDFKMVLVSILNGFWSGFGAKLETKLTEN
jgi:hypothetical protein